MTALYVWQFGILAAGHDRGKHKERAELKAA